MHYFDGSMVALGDVVNVRVPGGSARARVVMLGETYECLDIDGHFVEWVKRDRVLDRKSVVVEWLDGNPFSHTNPQYAPVGEYMFSALDEHVRRAC